MAKRFEHFKEFGRSTKKPKLDVSINRGRPLGPSQSWPNHIRPNVAEVARVDSQVRNGLNDNSIWGGDDDDLVLATQAVESQVVYQNTAPRNITESEITFSEFAPHVHATTSTQRITTMTCAEVKTTVSAPSMSTEKNNLSDLFLDDVDFAMIANAAENEKRPQTTSGTQKNHAEKSVFKKPTEVVSGIIGENKSQIMSVQEYATDGQSATARRQVATERQVKIMTERLDALKVENAKLAKELGESKAKIESKDGESSLLRDELRHMKQQLQKLKMEKIMSAEAAKTECKTKIAELTKRVEAKESELKLRNVEYSVLKMRHADETQRLEMSIRNANVAGDAPMEEGVVKASEKCNARLMYRLRNLSLTIAQRALLTPQLTEMKASAYERPQQCGATKRQHTPFQQELANAQTLLAQLQLQTQKRSWTTAEASAFNERAIASACNALAEFWTYVHGLEFPKHCNIHPYHDYDLRKDDQAFSVRNLHAARELHADERAISLRRYVAALSVMCAQAPNFAQQLLKQKHADYALLQVACHAISKLGYSSEVCAHFGTLEAFAALLRVLLRQAREDHFDLLVGGLLKQLVFARPSAWIFKEISYSMLELTRLPGALALLCVNSDETAFYSDRMRSIYRFSNDSCTLQVYAGLLEIAFPLNGVLSEVHLRLLAVICENHVRFTHHCFMKPPDFIHKLLPSYDDDDEDESDGENEQRMDATEEQSDKQLAGAPPDSVDNATTANDSNATVQEMAAQSKKLSNIKAGTRCECYTKLCLSVVTLLFQLMRQWHCTGRKIETPRVAAVSQISVQLLHTIFCDNYSTHLFRYAEETTKHYLWLICEYWSENAECLKFHSVQINFLNKLRTFHIMPKHLSEEGNVTNVINDLKEWHSLTNDNTSSDVATDTNVPLAAEKLDIMSCAVDDAKFFEGLSGYSFNFE